mgnify:FL=1
MMKNKILIYVVCFISFTMIFLTINYVKISDLHRKNSKSLNKKIDSLEKNLKLLDKTFNDEIYFSLKDNQEALKYFNDFEGDSLISYIRDQLYEKNFNKKSDFFIPISNNINKYLINKVKILNHRWIIADFSNGSEWGEMWIEYNFYNNKIEFDIKEYFLY